jgi:hypothetical protein
VSVQLQLKRPQALILSKVLRAATTRDDKISVWNPVVPADVNDTDITFNNEVITMSSMRDFNEDKNLGFELGM